MAAPREQHDQCEIYCRRLGHHLQFAYCRSTADGRPCRKILDCWFERFDVSSFLEDHLSEAELAEFAVAPTPKLSSLVTLVAAARERLG